MSSRWSFGLSGIFLRKGSLGIQTVKPSSGEGTSRQETGRAPKSLGRSKFSISDSSRDIEGALTSEGRGSFKNLNELKKSSTFFESSCFGSSSPSDDVISIYIR